MTGNPDYTPESGGQWTPYPVYPSGGIILAASAIFRNNKTDVRFYPYRDYDGFVNPKPNVSVFQNCTFETTKELLNNTKPDYHVRLDGVNEVVFKGCTFTNSRDGSVLFSDRGIGVYCYHSQVRFEKTNLSGITCTFEKMKYGIYSLYSGLGSASLTLDECELNGNQFGIYASGFTQVAPITITDCNVNMDQTFGASEFYGIYLNNCTGFDVRQNHFSASSLLSNTFGVVVNNAGSDNNYIYDNYFEHLTYGLQGLNINRNSKWIIEGEVPVFVPTGLRFICNKFHDAGCPNDFLINEDMEYPPTQPGIAYYQRNASNASNPTQEPAGNTFTQSHGSLTDEFYDINISTEVGSILYSHHTSSIPPDLRLEPNDVSNQDKVNYDPRPEVGDFVENSSSTQSYDVYQDLMGSSPYLSDTVLKVSIEKEDVLPNVMIRDIMVANPHTGKSDNLLTALDNRLNPMPDSLWFDIIDAADSLGGKEILENQLSSWIQRRDICVNHLIGLYRNDTIHSWAPDSLINLFESDDRVSSRYLLTQYYLDRFNFSEASYVLQNIPSEFSLSERQSATYQKILSLVDLFPQLFNDTLGYLVPDSIQAPILEQLADAGYELPGAWARNILVSAGLLDYQEPLVSETTLKSSRRDRFTWTHSRPIAADLKVFPNPAKDFVIAEYKKNNVLDQVQIVVLDAKGIKIRSYALQKAESQQLIPTNGLPSGIYLIQLRVNGLPTESRKVVIIR
ncbi:MAG: T9SS type A sorting domain-containing protein [Bacteroidota bacterium]